MVRIAREKRNWIYVQRGGGTSERIEWFIEDHAFSRSYDLAPRPSPHCPNSGPHFTPYRMYTTVAFLYREKNSAPMVMLYCENFYFSPVRHTWPSIIFLPVPVILCATSTKFTLFSNRMCGWSNFLLAIRATFVTCGFFLLPVRTKFMLLWRTASLRSAPHQQTPEPVYIVVDKLVHCDPNMYS